MEIVVVLPDVNYFLWQMIVQINNFRKLGIENKTTYIIGKRNIQVSNNLMKIINSDVNCNFHIFNDTRTNPQYSSSLRPHILAKFFEMYPDKLKSFLYLDPDVIFTKKVNYEHLFKDDIWYLSNTKSYIDSKYIKNKSEFLFFEMCNIVKIKQSIVENNDNSAGGAQYIIKNTNANFWKKVEIDSEELFKHMIATSNKYSPLNPIQAWTADMWALLWNAWKFKYKTKIVDELNFSWATDLMKKWDDVSIYHNAGAIVDDGSYFIKTKYQESPFGKKIKCNKNYCSYNYLKEVKDTERNLKNIIF